MQRKLLLMLLSLFVFSHIKAEEYTLTITNEPYTELTDAYSFSTPDTILPAYLVYLDPFSFSAFGALLGVDAASTGGQGVIVSIEGYIAANQLPNNDSIVSFHGYLCNNFRRRDSSSSISIKQEGASGKSIVKVQWKNFGFVGHAESDYTNFQIWLHEEGNLISYHYGPTVVTSKVAFKGAGGPVVGFSKADWPAFTTFSRSLYLTGDPGAPLFRHPTFLTVALGDVPANGTVYTFHPAVASAVAEHETPILTGYGSPNPFSDNIVFRIPHNGNLCKVVLYDILGHEVGSGSGRESITIGRGTLLSGIYFYRIFSGGNTLACGTVVAE